MYKENNQVETNQNVATAKNKTIRWATEQQEENRKATNQNTNKTKENKKGWYKRKAKQHCEKPTGNEIPQRKWENKTKRGLKGKKERIR